MNNAILFCQKFELNVYGSKRNLIIEIRCALSNTVFVFNLIRVFSDFQTYVRFSNRAYKSTRDLRDERFSF